jgi:hypothetical protein
LDIDEPGVSLSVDLLRGTVVLKIRETDGVKTIFGKLDKKETKKLISKKVGK